MKRPVSILFLACSVVATLALAAPAGAGQDPPAALPPDPAQETPLTAPPVAQQPPALGEEPPETEIYIDRQDQWAGRIGVQGPLGAALGLTLYHGLGADVRQEDGRVKAVCAAPLAVCAGGFLVDAAAGSGGGKLSLGLGARARVDEEDFRGTVGVALKASLVRTWGSPFGTEPELTYLGPELDLSILKVDVSLGVLWRLSGQGGKSALFSWGLGFGL
jgi:hypothetical protein